VGIALVNPLFETINSERLSLKPCDLTRKIQSEIFHVGDALRLFRFFCDLERFFININTDAGIEPFTEIEQS
jgi:hypothetical protein